MPFTSFTDEFPNDNPDIFVARPVTALHMAALRAYATPAPPAVAPRVEAAPEPARVEAAPEPARDEPVEIAPAALLSELTLDVALDEALAPVDLEIAPSNEARDAADGSGDAGGDAGDEGADDGEADAIEIEVEEFDDHDFEHATLESLAPPPPEVIDAADELRGDAECIEEVAEVSGADDVSVFAGDDGDAILDPAPAAETPAPEPAFAVESMSAPEPAPAPAPDAIDYAGIWESTLREVAAAQGASAEALVELAEELATDPVASAWRVVINGGDADFSACGAQTLDEWSAHLIARVANVAAKVEPIRRELRGRGVCAFGLVVEAA